MEKVLKYIWGFIKKVVNLLIGFILKILGVREEDLVVLSIKRLLVTALLFLVVTIIFFFGVLFISILFSPSVEVPDVEGKNLFDALVSLQRVGLHGWVEPTYVKEYPVWSVVKQFPKSGDKVKRGAQVRIVVNIGVEVEVPNVIGLSEEDAVKIIIASGLQVGNIEYVVNPGIQEGSVISQNPLPGKKVSRGSKVSLIVSSGAYQKEAVPNYIGGRFEDVARDIISRGYKLTAVPTPTDKPEEDGMVIAQDPKEGEMVLKGSTINIAVGFFGIPKEELDTIKLKVLKIELPTMQQTNTMDTQMDTQQEIVEVKIILNDSKSERIVFNGNVSAGSKIILPLKIWGGGSVKVFVNGLLYQDINV